MIRDRSSSALAVPVKRGDGLVWLSPGQFATLLWLRRSMRHGRGEVTLAVLAAATGCHPGTVSHRLDRLAQLGLIGRRSVPGRGHRTRYWPGRHLAEPRPHTGDCARHRHARRPAEPVGNVAPSTPSGGPVRTYVSRAGIRRAIESGRPPADAALPRGGRAGTDPLRRRRPPRVTYERCPRDGGVARLTLWRFRLVHRRLVAVWDGTCRRCGMVVVAPLDVTLPGDRWGMDRAGDVAAASSGIVRLLPDRAAARRSPAARVDVTAERRALAAAFVAGEHGELPPELAAELAVRWLDWKPPAPESHPLDLTGLPADRRELRLAAWDAGLSGRHPRYSQRSPAAGAPDPSVRIPQPGGAVDGPPSVGDQAGRPITAVTSGNVCRGVRGSRRRRPPATSSREVTTMTDDQRRQADAAADDAASQADAASDAAEDATKAADQADDAADDAAGDGDG